MEDLRLVGLSADGSRLVLENAAGQSVALPLDERVHAALRGDRSRLGQLQIAIDGQIRPREIQARIRAGHSAEEVAATAGLPLDSVRRFETPILLERTHMAQTAQKVGVRRVTDSATTPLGELVQGRLRDHGVAPDELDWDSWRRDDGRWQVVLRYAAGGRERTAAWMFDPVRRILEPADDEARWLTEPEADTPVPAPRARQRSAGPRLASVPAPQSDTEQAEHLPGSSAEASAEPSDSSDSSDETPGAQTVAVQEPAQSPAPATRRGAGRRAAVPSWDEILFGSAPRRDGD
jgi:Protein of unknown function (DUF3071)